MQRLQPFPGETVGIFLPAAGREDAPAPMALERLGAVVANSR